MPRNEKKSKQSSKKSTVKRTSVTKPTAEKPKAATPVVTAVAKPAVVETAVTKAPTVQTPEVKTAAVAEAQVASVAATPVIDRELLATLIGELRSMDADRAREAAVSLGGIRDVSSTEALISVLNNTEGYFHSVVRSAAAASLGQLGDVRALEALTRTVDDEMAEASAEAVRALALLGDEKAVDTLVAVLRNTNGYYLPVVRLAAVHGLAKFKTDRAKEELSYVASDSYEDSVIRDAASNATR